MNIVEVKNLADAIRAQMAKAIIGQTDTLDLLLTGLFAGGHVLLEGPPGTAKTFLTQCFSQTLGLKYGRIQFTPDLMPGDILGTNLYNFQTGQFSLTKGPIFCDLLLADEINRTPPKTQAALLEAMQERQVTLDGQPHALGEHFMVVATQNPIEQQGTYPLPEAQLDRFLFKHLVGYPTASEETAMVTAHGNRTGQPSPAALGVATVANPDLIRAAIRTAAENRLNPDIIAYIVALVRLTREDRDLSVGASPRSGAMLATASRAHAALQGRDYVLPDDVKTLFLPAMRHRVILAPGAEIDGRQVDEILTRLCEQVPAPR